MSLLTHYYIGYYYYYGRDPLLYRRRACSIFFIIQIFFIASFSVDNPQRFLVIYKLRIFQLFSTSVPSRQISLPYIIFEVLFLLYYYVNHIATPCIYIANKHGIYVCIKLKGGQIWHLMSTYYLYTKINSCNNLFIIIYVFLFNVHLTPAAAATACNNVAAPSQSNKGKYKNTFPQQKNDHNIIIRILFNQNGGCCCCCYFVVIIGNIVLSSLWWPKFGQTLWSPMLWRLLLFLQAKHTKKCLLRVHQ